MVVRPPPARNLRFRKTAFCASDTLGLEAVHFSTDRLMLVTARKHRFAKRRRTLSRRRSTKTPSACSKAARQQGSTLQAFLAQITDNLGKRQKLRIQLGGFDAMCRMIGSGVGIGVVPESAARRNQDSMQLALVDLSDARCVRERSLLVRNRAALPICAQALVDTLLRHDAGPQAAP